MSLQGGLSHARGPPLHNPKFRSCWERMNDAVSRYPDNVAIVSLHQSAALYGYTSQELRTQAYEDQSYLRWTYGNLKKAGEALARSMRIHGAVVDTPVFTFVGNGIELVLLLWACGALGCHFIPLNPRNLANETDLKHMLQLALRHCDRRKAFVVTDSIDSAMKIDTFEDLAHAHRIMANDGPWQTWESFATTMSETAGVDGPSQEMQMTGEKSTDSAVFFTSGTTALPKGVHLHYPHFPSAMIAINEAAGDKYVRSSEDVFAVVGPNNHLLCHLFLVSSLGAGTTVVFPSASFDAGAFVQATELERVTHTAVTPTMVHQIATLIAKHDRPLHTRLQSIMLGGNGVSPEVIRLCTDQLGTSGVEVMYGNTEGTWVNSGFASFDELVFERDVSVGRCKPGQQIKICAPESRDPLPLGTPGELHYQSLSLAEGYIDQPNSDFYQGQGGEPWMRTGDQAVMHADGRVFIVGRYKEMIIRGGENISPMAIESCINRVLPHLARLQLQVVACPDPIAGEIPVAITAAPVSEKTAADIQQAVFTHMGPIYALVEVIAVQDLGVSELPRTTAGKIRKTELKDLVSQRWLRRQRRSNGLREYSDDIASRAISVMARAVGLDEGRLNLQTELSTIGDSISMMRFRDRLSKTIGRTLSIEDIASAPTIADLVRLLENQQQQATSTANQWQLPRRGTTSSSDMLHVLGDPEKYSRTREMVTNTIAEHGLGWDDVCEVFPSYDFTDKQARNGAFERWAIKIGIVARSTDVARLHQALMETLSNNPMQGSFIAWADGLPAEEENALHVIVQWQSSLLAKLVTVRESLPSVHEFKLAVLENNQRPELPGPLFHASLFELEAEQCAALLINMHHSVTDASFMQIFCEDLDAALSGKPLHPHVPYRLYCESIYTLSNSPAALLAASYHATRLTGLAEHRPHVWPSKSLPFLPEDSKDGHIFTFPADSVLHFCKRYRSLAPSLILKAATALFLQHKSGHTHALFAHVEAARDAIPFMPAMLANAARLSAADVGGQLFQSVVNIVSFAPTETVIDFLERLQEEQEIQHKYCAAPWKAVMSRLDPASAVFFPEIAAWCMFNWMGTTYVGDKAFDNLEIVSTAARRCIVPFVNNCALQRDQTGEDKIMLHIRGAVFENEMLKAFAEDIAKIAEWLTSAEHELVLVCTFKTCFV